MELFARLIPQGSDVLDIGAHIGYMTQYFSALTGAGGRVFGFEPSPENLLYLRANSMAVADRNITVVECAAGECDGSDLLYYESVTGQNSTITRDFPGLAINTRFNGLAPDYKTCTVSTRTVDSLVDERGIRPGFIKIDAEGGEYGILLGMLKTMTAGPRLMVEINMHHAEIFALLVNAGYLLFDDSCRQVHSIRPEFGLQNRFAIHAADADGLSVMKSPG